MRTATNVEVENQNVVLLRSAGAARRGSDQYPDQVLHLRHRRSQSQPRLRRRRPVDVFGDDVHVGASVDAEEETDPEVLLARYERSVGAIPDVIDDTDAVEERVQRVQPREPRQQQPRNLSSGIVFFLFKVLTGYYLLLGILGLGSAELLIGNLQSVSSYRL